MGNSGIRLRQLSTADLTEGEVKQIRTLMWAAFAEDEHGGFTAEDWAHSLGGMHFVLDVEGRIVSHASVVARDLHVDAVPLATGYVEAVATAPDSQRRGYGTAVMREVNDHVVANFELGALGTGSQPFYERLGWQVWRGPSSVRTTEGEQPTPGEDGYIMVLLTPSSPEIDLEAPISCDWRPGDVW